MNKSNFDNLKYILLILSECAIFGFSFVVLQILFDLGCPSFLLMSLRFFIGFVSLLAFKILINYKNKGPSKINFKKNELLYGSICGVFLFVAFGMQTCGAYYTTSARNALFTALYVIIVPLFMSFIKKKFSCKTFFVAFLCFIGVLVLNIEGIDSNQFNVGDVLSIVCAVFFAVHFCLLDSFSKKSIDFINFTAVQIFVVFVLSGIFSLTVEFNLYSFVVWEKAIWWLLFLGIISTAITYYIQTVVQANLSVNTVSVLSCSETVFAVVMSLMLGYDTYSWQLIVGLIIIVSAMVCASIQSQKKIKGTGLRTRKQE